MPPTALPKKMLLVQAQAYRQQYGFNAIYLLPVNLYGPHDNFDLKTSHVIPALIHKCVIARDQGLDRVEVWGTGNASREFLYVEDAAEGIVMAAVHYDDQKPVNIGSGQEISIRALCWMVAHAVGYKGKFVWNEDKPDGQPRRKLDTTRAREYFGFQAKTPLLEGLRHTVRWYEENMRPRIQPTKPVASLTKTL